MARSASRGYLKTKRTPKDLNTFGNDRLSTYRPPPGTRPDGPYEQRLDRRCSALVNELGWPSENAPQSYRRLGLSLSFAKRLLPRCAIHTIASQVSCFHPGEMMRDVGEQRLRPLRLSEHFLGRQLGGKAGRPDQDESRCERKPNNQTSGPSLLSLREINSKVPQLFAHRNPIGRTAPTHVEPKSPGLESFCGVTCNS